ncbi:cell division protein FtsX [Tepidimicrobium xylanilyticum]|uniref:Cell division protein FtsX n=1 Tax=Tepidimicrobium xylanilyticum TaxID=1123352 RepID=A0A1H2RKV7_9FIRM|nr:permease-like cell division protein FtsX [Tepidimicrobium xylanilyticum]GMG95390.1 cell division protein FtsX [Tepidimicrobium xylanilyticum]SDW20113.1 cell division protein FtsX [Tepidimicrobium xylanilyticum]
MSKKIYNLVYFLKESKTLFKIDFFSNLFSIISIGLIFFILSLVLLGWRVSNYIIEIVESEAEINVYFDLQLKEDEIKFLMEDIEKIDGVSHVTLVSEKEAYNRMAEILGKEAHILELFDENPFTPFIEVKIHIEEVDSILAKLEFIKNIDYIRDNKNIIDRLQRILIILKVIGVLAIVAIGVSTLIVVSHIIRQGIYNNRDQINTLELLGAPDTFIGFPFLLEGLFLTLIGGLIACLLLSLTVNLGYSKLSTTLTFMPLPTKDRLILPVGIFIITISGILGVLGSLFGLAKHNEKN